MAALAGCTSVPLIVGAAAAAPMDQRAVESSDLRAAVEDAESRRFYEARGWRPVWTEARRSALLAALSGAERHGLPTMRYRAAEDAGASDPVKREVALTGAALAYARALAMGAVDPASVHDIYTLARPAFDAASALAGALADGDLAGWFDTLPPQTDEYRALSRALAEARAKVGSGNVDPIPSGPLIRPDDRDARVRPIVAALARHGQDVTSAPPKGYTGQVVEAVRRFQAERALAVDGVIGPETRAALNRGPAERAIKLAVNLERLRWRERTPPSSRIDVNTAAAELTLLRDGRIVDRRPVAVGQSGWETPQLESPIYRLVANPTWTVPKSIEREELAGKSAAYLEQRNMVRRDGWIVQQPGPNNALGRVKLDMLNDHAIYLHDTPNKTVFERGDRHVSHGCVRVEDAPGFARLLAGEAGKRDDFDAALGSGQTRYIDLDERLPVRLMYQTAFLQPDGSVRVVRDAYGWDDRIAEALGLGRVGERPTTAHAKEPAP